MRNGWKQLAVCGLGCLLAGLSGCATMQNIGNSLAFWKKSPPKDQFATNLNTPSSSFNPTGTSPTAANGMNGMANNGMAGGRPSNMPFGNTGRPSNSFGSAGNGMSPSGGMASKSPGSVRSPYGGQMPGSKPNSGFGNANKFAEQPAAHMANNTRANGMPSGNGGFSPKGGSFSPRGGSSFSNNSFNPSATNPSASGGSFSTSTPSATPSSQFRNKSAGFNPSAGSAGMSSSTGRAATPPNSFSPTNVDTSAGTRTGSPAPTSAKGNWNNYPTTNYPGFGSTSPKQPASDTNIGMGSKNVPASANMSPPPSLPANVFEKQGGYSPGSTGSSGKASQAGFESNSGFYSPPTGSKIPSTPDLYTPK